MKKESVQTTKNSVCLQDCYSCALSSIQETAYEWDIVSDTLQWYGGIHEKLGYTKNEFPCKKRNWNAFIHPDDREPVRKAIYRHLKTGNPYHIRYRVRCKENRFTCVSDSGTAVKNDFDTPFKFAGVIQILN